MVILEALLGECAPLLLSEELEPSLFIDCVVAPWLLNCNVKEEVAVELAAICLPVQLAVCMWYSIADVVNLAW
tara:strand:+ start:400 stop:618 length:219 start_codon:yes stop_codon:yes gene_type:complete